MKIKLDQSEIGQILINWGKERYKTHNVSVVAIANDGAEIEVILDELGMSNSVPQEATDEFIRKMQVGLPRAHVPPVDEPDLTPDFAGASEGLI